MEDHAQGLNMQHGPRKLLHRTHVQLLWHNKKDDRILESIHLSHWWIQSFEIYHLQDCRRIWCASFLTSNSRWLSDTFCLPVKHTSIIWLTYYLSNELTMVWNKRRKERRLSGNFRQILVNYQYVHSNFFTSLSHLILPFAISIEVPFVNQSSGNRAWMHASFSETDYQSHSDRVLRPWQRAIRNTR